MLVAFAMAGKCNRRERDNALSKRHFEQRWLCINMQGNFKQVKQHQLHTCQLIYSEILQASNGGVSVLTDCHKDLVKGIRVV